MQNHLIIGLGGTGGKILRALRKNIFQEYRSNEPSQVNIGYLYIDSSKEMMSIDDNTWRILGESVQLPPRSQLLITGSNLSQILDNLGGHPHIQPWIGNREQWKDILNSIVGETLGGQKRRLGRFLFACKARQFKDQITQLVAELTTGGDAKATFHVCCGLSGGTGSGTLVDVAAQLRALYRDSRMYRIILYALLPEEFPNPNWDTGNYHANGYAALLELNALSIGAYLPHNVSERGERLALSDPFNGCYIFSNRNENGLQVDIDKVLPDIVADFLFQKLVSVRNAEATKILEKMENAENGDGTPETRIGSIVPLRGKRFLTFGIKRLAIPEVEIREYLTYTFARQAALQLRYNYWDDTLGFMDKPRHQDFGEFVRDKQTLERWLLTDEHLTLSLGILPEETNNRKWKPLINEWLDIIPQFIELVQSQDANNWLNEIEKLMKQRFEENYRGLGVSKFYEVKLQARKDHVRELRRRVEEEWFDEWKNGVKSMHDIATCMSALIAFLEERLLAVDDRIARTKANIDHAEQKTTANRKEWAEIGFISSMLGKRRNLLDIHGEVLRELYTARTQLEAWAFAKKLLQESISEYNSFANDVSACTKLVDESVKEFKARIDQRCNDSSTPDLRQSLVRFYNADYVRSFARDLEKDKSVQVRQSQLVRTTLIEPIASERSFSAFQAKMSRQRFFDVLEQKCTISSQTAHDALVSSHRDRRPLLGVNIIAQLERQYSGRTDDLKKFIHNLVNQAGNFLECDPQAIVLGAAKVKVSQFLVILPVPGELTSFTDTLKSLFRDNFRGDIPVEIIESGTKPNEITLLGLTNLFPLRYAKATAFLKERYDRRIQQSNNNQSRIKMELHSEGDGSQWPELLIADERVFRENALPSLLLAKILGLITAVTSPTTGVTEFYLIDKDEDGLPVRTRLGKTLNEVYETIDILSAQALEDKVNLTLAQDSYRHVDKRTECQQAVRDELNTILTEARNDFEDPTYRKFEAAARTAIQKLKKIG